jgi:CDP-diacylglycerol--glycerol-3-phosphate 3-phosphatidyltransferase
VNLPNWITVGRILLTPLVAWLPFIHSATLRGLAFVLFLVVAISDHYDGKLARARNEITDLGRLLDPLADKIFLLATFIPMYMLQAPRGEWLAQLLPRATESSGYPFVTWAAVTVPFPWWVLFIVLGREAAMTWFRQAASRKGVVIAALGPGKAKTTFQFIWVGAAYFWFAFRTWVEEHGFTDRDWDQIALAVGSVGTLCMLIAVVLTVWSFAVYVRRYGSVLR